MSFSSISSGHYIELVTLMQNPKYCGYITAVFCGLCLLYYSFKNMLVFILDKDSLSPVRKCLCKLLSIAPNSANTQGCVLFCLWSAVLKFGLRIYI